MKNEDKSFIVLVVTICIFIAFCVTIGLIKDFINNKQKDCNTSPVKEMRIDTLYITRDSLIYRTKYLDSIKYDTIQKVYNLNDTATLQLFLQLVSE